MLEKVSMATLFTREYMTRNYNETSSTTAFLRRPFPRTEKEYGPVPVSSDGPVAKNLPSADADASARVTDGICRLPMHRL
uniref:Uncharacterized protein n=1 Tax=Romanomermis culicivorax TaxID=13658 RepID=A0A915KF43_ROMCU